MEKLALDATADGLFWKHCICFLFSKFVMTYNKPLCVSFRLLPWLTEYFQGYILMVSGFFGFDPPHSGNFIFCLLRPPPSRNFEWPSLEWCYKLKPKNSKCKWPFHLWWIWNKPYSIVGQHSHFFIVNSKELFYNLAVYL